MLCHHTHLMYMFITGNLYYEQRTHAQSAHQPPRQTGQLVRSRAEDRTDLTSAAVSTIRSPFYPQSLWVIEVVCSLCSCPKCSEVYSYEELATLRPRISTDRSQIAVLTPIGSPDVCKSVDSCLGHDMTPPPSRGIDVLVELAPLLGLAPIRLLLADADRRVDSCQWYQ